MKQSAMQGLMAPIIPDSATLYPGYLAYRNNDESFQCLDQEICGGKCDYFVEGLFNLSWLG